MARSLIFAVLALVLSLDDSTSHAAPKPALVQHTKAATVLVDMHEEGTGSGFCIRDDGVFITNHHVIDPTEIGGLVDVVLNPSERNERVIKARVLKVDAVADLALLKANGVKGLPALDIGSTKNLIETTSLIVFGYPLGKLLATKTQGYPSISVNTGKVSALRLSKGMLESIQLDAAVNPGNSGGPVIDEQGKVIGVIVSGYDGTGINFAIPSNVVRKFLDKPSFIVTPTRFRYADRHRPIRFDIELIQLNSKQQPDRFEMTLVSDSGSERKFSAKRDKSGVYVMASPQVQPSKRERIHVSAEIDGLHATMEVEDHSFQIGSRQLALSEIRRIEKRPTAYIVTSATGQKYAGKLKGLDQLKFLSGTRFDPMTADRLTAAAPNSGDNFVDYTLTAWQNSQRVATTSGTLDITGMPARVSKDPYDLKDPFSPLVDSFTIEARIDGEVKFNILPGGFYLTHGSFFELGLKDDIGRYIFVNGKKWYVDWYKTKDKKIRSNSYPLKIAIGRWEHKVLWMKPSLKARHATRSIQIRSGSPIQSSVDYMMTINDTAPGGAHFKVLFRRVPPKLPVLPKVSAKVPPMDGHWSFDEDSGNVVKDSTGNGQHGRLTFPSRVPGKIGEAVEFNGFGAIRCGDVAEFDQSDQFSIGAWFYPNMNTKSAIVSKIPPLNSSSPSRGYDLLFDDRRISMHLTSSWPKNAIEVFSTTQLASYQWHFVMVTYDGSSRADGIQMYLNGREVDKQITLDSLSGSIQSKAPFCIGGIDQIANFQGRIDDVFVYRRVLAKNEIDQIYARGFDRSASRRVDSTLKNGLVSHWTLDKADGPLAKIDGKRSTALNDPHVPGKIGKALEFGRTGNLDCGMIVDLDSDKPFSFGAWMNARASKHRPIISRFDRHRHRGYELMLHEGKVLFQLIEQRRRRLMVNTRSSFPLNGWHHVFATYDGSKKAAGVQILVDGRPAPLKVLYDKLQGSIKSELPLSIGSRAGEIPFDGKLDEVRIYDRKLSETEVLQLTELRSASNANSDPNLIGYWNFDNDDGTLIRDTSGNKLDGQYRIGMQTPQRVAGRVGKAISLNGLGSIDLGNKVGDFEADDKFSISTWVKFRKMERRYIASKIDTRQPNPGYGLVLEAEGTLFFQLLHLHLPQQKTMKCIRVRAKSVLKTDQWYHVTVTYNGSRKAAGVNLYLDGKPVELQTIDDDLETGSIRTNFPFRIGSTLTLPPVIGKVDEFRIFSRELTAQDVAKLASTK